MDVDTGPADEDLWVLRFDGACRRNPGPGGAGAVLFAPSGAVVWTCSHYMPSSSETNNTAEYTALQLGVQSATHHGATHLNIEGDSSLVIAQVKGSFACRNARLRQLRNRVRHALRSMTTYKLRHIDRKANAHADRLANRALDQRSDSSEIDTSSSSAPVKPPQRQRPATTPRPTKPWTSKPRSQRASPGSAPARQPRLRMRHLTDDEHEAAADALQTVADDLASKIADADSWASGEGYISAIPERLREALQPFATRPPQPGQRHQQQRRRPPRVTRTQREHRLDEAMADLQATQQVTPRDRRAVRRA
ncbi:reverse transcriptase, partial [Phytophthora palmivora]